MQESKYAAFFQQGLLDRLQGCYLITGATGFLGNALVKMLIHLNNTVWKEKPSHLKLLVREPEKILISEKNIQLFKYNPASDLQDIGEVDYIIHCAGICDSRQFATRPWDVLNVNLISTLKILDFASLQAHIKGMVSVSSGYIYSPNDNQILREEDYIFSRGDLTDFSNSYIVSKIASECYCKSAFIQKGVPVNVIRPFNIYGPGLNLNHGGILTEVLRACSSNTITMMSEGMAVRNFIYIMDVVSAILYCLATESHGESYNVCSDKEITVAGLVELAQKIYRSKGMDVSVCHKIVESCLVSDTINFYPDNTKLKRLGWKEEVTLEMGMEHTIDYYINCVKNSRELPPIGFGTWKLPSSGG